MSRVFYAQVDLILGYIKVKLCLSEIILVYLASLRGKIETRSICGL
jgi:hypothetical protein